MNNLIKILAFVCLNLGSVLICCCQQDRYNAIVNSITGMLERINMNAYYVSGIEIDEAIKHPEESDGRIRDPYHTLAGCFLFLAEGKKNADVDKEKGFIGLYRISVDSVIWQSELLSENFSSGALGSIDATDELNQDGKVEIIIGQATGNLAINHQLWIFNWDGKNGKLITQLDRYGKPEIIYWGDNFDIKDVDGDGIYEILGKWYKKHDSKAMTTVVYSWNGSLYGKWGKSSKYLLKGTKR